MGKREEERKRVGLSICDALPTPKPTRNESGGKKRGRHWVEEGGSGGDYGYTQSLIKQKKKSGPWVFVVSGDGSSCLGRLNNTACVFRPYCLLWEPLSGHYSAILENTVDWTQAFSRLQSVFASNSGERTPPVLYVLRYDLSILEEKNRGWCWQPCLLSYKFTADLNSRSSFVDHETN